MAETAQRTDEYNEQEDSTRSRVIVKQYLTPVLLNLAQLAAEAFLCLSVFIMLLCCIYIHHCWLV